MFSRRIAALLLCLPLAGSAADTLAGRVVEDHSGNPVAPAEVRIATGGVAGGARRIHSRPSDRRRAARRLRRSARLFRTGRTAPPVQVAYPDAQSLFTLGGLRPGRYRIAAQKAGEASRARRVPELARLVEIQMPGGAPTDLDPPAPPGEKKPCDCGRS